MTGITDVGVLPTEVVLTERIATTEFKITEVHEHVNQREVRVEVDLGPFTTEEGPGGNVVTRGSSRRSVVAWRNEEYDAVRDTWANADLIARVTTLLG